MKLAVIQTGGKQYKVSEGQVLTIEKLNVEGNGKTVVFDQVLLVNNGEETKLGTPTLAGAKVSAEILEQGRHDKVTVIKFKPKTGHRRKYGHRQPYTKVKIIGIES